MLWRESHDCLSGIVACAPKPLVFGATPPAVHSGAGALCLGLPQAYLNLTRNTNTLTTMDEHTRDTDLIVLGRALRALRDRAGLTQEQLADRLQMDATYVSRIERGRRGVQWLTVQRFLRALDASLGDLAAVIDESSTQGPVSQS